MLLLILLVAMLQKIDQKDKRQSLHYINYAKNVNE